MTFTEDYDKVVSALESYAESSYLDEMIRKFIATEAETNSVGAWIKKTMNHVVAAITSFINWLSSKVMSIFTHFSKKATDDGRSLQDSTNAKESVTSEKLNAAEKMMELEEERVSFMVKHENRMNQLTNMLGRLEDGQDRTQSLHDEILRDIDELEKALDDLMRDDFKNDFKIASEGNVSITLESDNSEPKSNKIRNLIRRMQQLISNASKVASSARKNAMAARAAAQKAQAKNPSGRIARIWSKVPRMFASVGKYLSGTIAYIRKFFSTLFKS